MKHRLVAKIVLGSVLGAALTSGYAAELFGTLVVTDKPKAAHAKLIAMGYSGFGVTERATCVVDDQCLGTFTGPSVTKGFVRFSPSGIRSVYLETSSTAEIIAALTRKHGPHTTPTSAASNSFVAAIQNQQMGTHVWNLKSGVQISIRKDGSVTYYSPEVFGAPPDTGGVKNF